MIGCSHAKIGYKGLECDVSSEDQFKAGTEIDFWYSPRVSRLRRKVSRHPSDGGDSGESGS
jgi:hypothetical protein